MSITMILGTGFGIFFFLEIVAVAAFCIHLLRSSSRPIDERVWPRVTMLMPIRGADPGLKEVLHRLLSLDYPSYELRLIIDSQEDPAWPIVREVQTQTESRRLVAESVSHRSEHCGLTCNSLLQGLRSLAEDTQVIVFVDSDIGAFPGLLKHLVAPLNQPTVGATFGNRWYRPKQSSWGALTRQMWNLAAVIPMWLFQIPWGGCMAIRRDALEQSGVCDVLARSMVQDAPLQSLLTRQGFRLQFVPSLLIPNTESCNLSFATQFITRQMLWTRLYHSGFLAVIFQACGLFGLLLTTIGLIVGSLALSNVESAWLLSAYLALYLSLAVVLVAVMEGVVSVTNRRIGLPLAPVSTSTWLQLPAAIVMTHGIYLWALCRACGMKSVTWRGITYHIAGPFDIERQGFVPFAPRDDAQQGDSL